ncbi:MAG TPA: bifunctional precorrin-2 dehydrogenase/sirohydrochlorin ferrochelatase [Polyangiaceae bacterium]|nr:bifunctional precorrin-2 dehydrogenase/sirohydrochlorin ferrochelatase [Polyangiaceae bacterium]
MRSSAFPIGLKLEGRLCLVVGAGEEAERRTDALVAAGARVRVVSERPTQALERLAHDGTVALSRRAFDDADLDGAWLAVYTDLDVAVATRIAAVAEERRVFFCAVDRPGQSSWSHLAIATAGPVTVAVSTSGRAPSLARRLRDELARVFDESRLGEFAEAIARLREGTPPEDRRAVLGHAVSHLRFDGALSIPDGDRIGPRGREKP